MKTTQIIAYIALLIAAGIYLYTDERFGSYKKYAVTESVPLFVGAKRTINFHIPPVSQSYTSWYSIFSDNQYFGGRPACKSSEQAQPTSTVSGAFVVQWTLYGVGQDGVSEKLGEGMFRGPYIQGAYVGLTQQSAI